MMSDDVVVGGDIVEHRGRISVGVDLFSQSASVFEVFRLVVVVGIHFSILRVSQFLRLRRNGRVILEGLPLDCVGE